MSNRTLSTNSMSLMNFLNAPSVGSSVVLNLEASDGDYCDDLIAKLEASPNLQSITINYSDFGICLDSIVQWVQESAPHITTLRVKGQRKEKSQYGTMSQNYDAVFERHATQASSSSALYTVSRPSSRTSAAAPRSIPLPPSSRSTPLPRAASPSRSSSVVPRAASPSRSTSVVPRAASPSRSSSVVPRAASPSRSSGIPRAASPSRSSGIPRAASPSRSSSVVPRAASPSRSSSQESASIPRLVGLPVRVPAVSSSNETPKGIVVPTVPRSFVAKN